LLGLGEGELEVEQGLSRAAPQTGGVVDLLTF
jgi:hypothetical protein